MANSNAYMREYMKQRYYRRRAAAIQQLGGCCAECGSIEGLEIDHIDPTEKQFNVGKALAGWAEARLQAELAKCQLLCAVHHAEKTAQALRKPITHGTLSGYDHYKCRCELCRIARTEYVRNRRLCS